MAWVIPCECGTFIRGATDDELVQNAQQHAKGAHGITLTAEQALGLAEPE